MTSDKQNPYLALGKRLADLRSQQGWSLRKASQLIGGISHSRLQDFEKGVDPHSGIPTRPSEEQLRQMARAYKADQGELLRLAGFSTVGRLTDFEEALIVKVRNLKQGQLNALLSYLEELVKSGQEAGEEI